MLQLDAQNTAQALPWVGLIDALQAGFQSGCEAPLRHQHQFDIPGEKSGTLVLMPAWIAGSYMGIKQILVIPENHRRSRSSVSASYQLFSAVNGELLASIDGAELSNRRTAAASALASRFLSRQDASHLLMVGTGGLARSIIPAHAAIRPIERVSIWGRNIDKARELADEMQRNGLPAYAVDDLAAASKQAHIISCATLSEAPLVLGDWLQPGSHLDLVGAFRPNMRESDDQAMRIASIFVDTRTGALAEGGDLIQAIDSGAIEADDIVADLAELCRGQNAGRQTADEITAFKSVGTALEDLYAAVFAYQGVTTSSQA